MSLTDDMNNWYNHRRHLEDEMFDEIRFKTVPRFKQSNLSGDEWRTCVVVDFMYKGIIGHSFTANSMKYAMLMLGDEYLKATCPIGDEVINREYTRCDQPGCSAEFDVVMEITGRLTAKDGSFLDPSEKSGHQYRKFCKQHSHRGDCDREDNDNNYKVIPIPPSLQKSLDTVYPIKGGNGNS